MKTVILIIIKHYKIRRTLKDFCYIIVTKNGNENNNISFKGNIVKDCQYIMLGCINNLITGITVIVNLEHLSRRLFFVIALTSNEKKNYFMKTLKTLM